MPKIPLLNGNSKFNVLRGFFIFLLSCVPILIIPTAANASGDLAFPSGVNGGFNTSGFISIASATGTTPSVSNFASSSYKVAATATSGKLKITNTSNLSLKSGAFDGSQSTIVFTTSALTDVNNAIATLAFKADSPGQSDITLEITDASGNAWVSGTGANGHYYEVVSGSLTWQEAKTAAELRTVPSTVDGQNCSGYLVTITSAEEQAFVINRVSADSWIGASDDFNYIFDAQGNRIYPDQSSSEGKWYWVTGPENGTQLLTANSKGAVAGNAYNNFNDGEPNNYYGSEDYGQLYSGSGFWNDLAYYAIQNQYITEYGSPSCIAGAALVKTMTANAAGTPSAPSGLTATAGDSQIEISFNDATEAQLNGGALERYEYRQDGGTWISLEKNTSKVITGLTNGTLYSFEIRTITKAGVELESSASAAVSTRPNVPPTNTSIPTITGVAKVGTEFTSTYGVWTSFGPTTYTYQWQKSPTSGGTFENISDATNSTYTASDIDAGQFLRLAVTATNSLAGLTAYSLSTIEILDSNAINVEVPTITGLTKVGGTLTADIGNWLGTRNAYTFKWYRSGVLIDGATGSTFDLTSTDVGSKLQVEVTAANTSGVSLPALSIETAVITKATQTLTEVDSLNGLSFPYTDGQAFVSAKSDRNLIIDFAASTPTICSVGSETLNSDTTTAIVTFIQAGTCTITTNQAGDASYVSASLSDQSFDILFTAPTIPQSVTTSIAGTVATVSWIEPASNGGSPILNYTVTLIGDVNPVTCISTITSCVFNNLTAGITYSATVTAQTSGANPISSEQTTAVSFAIPTASTVTTPGTIPGEIVPVAPSVILSTINTADQQTLATAGVVQAPTGTPSVVISGDLTSGSFTTNTNITILANVFSGSELIFSFLPPTDTPVGTELRGYIELLDGSVMSIGTVVLDAPTLAGGIITAGFTIVPEGVYRVYFYLGSPTVLGNQQANAFFNSDDLQIVPADFVQIAAPNDSGQVQITYEVTISAGPNGLPLLKFPTPTPPPPAPTPSPTVSESATPTPTPTPSTSATPLPTESPTVEPTPSPATIAEPVETQLDSRGLEVINPLQDAPVAVAQTTLTAVTLIAAVTAASSAASALVGAAAGAAAGGAAGAAAGAGSSRPSGAGSTRADTGSNTSSKNEDSEDQGSVTNIDFDHEGYETEKSAWGDTLAFWAIPAMKLLDRPSHNTIIKLSTSFPLLSKLISDGAYLRAIIGSISITLPALGVVIGLISTIQAGGQVLPPSGTMLLLIAVVGAIDALAGFIAVSIISIGLVLFAGLHTAGDIRMLFGLFVVGFGPALLSGSFRRLRRQAANQPHEWWERLVDLAVVPFLGGWTTKGMVSALPALAGVKLTVADYASEIAIAVAIALFIRVILEEFTSQFFPARLNFIHPTDIPSPKIVQKVFGLTMRAVIFFFVAQAFIGSSWHLYAGTLMFIVPSYLGLIQNKFPNFPKLYQLLPSGLPGLAFNLLVASGALTILTAVLGATPDLAKLAFVLLPIPSVIISILSMLGREPHEGDVKWYLRDHLTLLYRFGGIAMFFITLNLADII